MSRDLDPAEWPAPSAVALALADLARTDPERIVLADGTRRFTAVELEHHVAGLAATLADLPRVTATAGPDWLPILVGRSVWSTVALLAAIQAGRAVCLLDPATPPPALADQLARLGRPAAMVVTAPDQLGEVPGGVLVVDAAARPSPPRLDPVAVALDDPALVLFTSGSTGRPKGVVRPWDTWERFVRAQRDGIPTGVLVGRRHAVLRPLHFVAALDSQVSCVLGAEVHLLDATGATGAELVATLGRLGIESLDAPHAVVHGIVRAAGGARILPDLRMVTFAGEPVPTSLVDELRCACAPDLVVRGRYGSVEGGGRLAFDVGASDVLVADRLPLGRPAQPGDVHLDRVGEDGVGELLLGDPDATHYLDDVELTRARFVTDAEGGRWWRSGDLAERTGDGCVHFRGRLDDIVKIRGVQVEPVAVERALQAVPGVVEAAVLVDQDGRGRPRLVGHVVVASPATTAEHVRRYLAEGLPGPCIPSTLVRHDALPVSGTGKLDRAALKLGPATPWTTSTSRPPACEAEWTVCGVAAELLELPEVHPQDDLWLLGLDSLGAVELSAALSDTFGRPWDPRTLLELSTPADLAAHALAAPVGERPVATVLNGDGAAAPVFVVPGAGQTVLAFRALARALAPDHPVVVVEAHGMHARGRPDRSIEAMARRVVTEIDRYLGARTTRDCLVTGHSAGALVAYEVAQQRAARGHATRVVLIDGAPDHVEADVPGALRVEGMPAPAMERLRRHRFREVPGIVRRQSQILWYSAIPTEPTNHTMRYIAMYRAAARAVQRYRPRPAMFECGLVHVAGSSAPQRLAPWAPDATRYEVGGDHRSCLEHPHSIEVAAAITAELARDAR